MRSSSPILITSFPRPNNVSIPDWSNSTHWFRRKSADKKLCRRRQDPHQKYYGPAPPPPSFFFWGGHNLALIDPVVSEKKFEEYERRHRRACLYDKLTNQYIKRSARIIRSKMFRIKMTYTFEDAVKKDNKNEPDFTGSVTKNILKCDFALKQFLRQLTGQTFIFIDSTFQMLNFIGRGFTEVQILKNETGPISWTLWNSLMKFPLPIDIDKI